MNLDDYKTGLHDSDSPMNRENEISECQETELEEANRKRHNAEMKASHLKSLLKEAGGIFELYRMTGSITEKELNRLTEIFEPYLL